MKNCRISIFVIFISIAFVPAYSQVKINEFMAANASWKYDPIFFNFSSWLEIYNAGISSVDISGYSLSDNPLYPKRWSFPAGSIIPAKGFLLVWTDKQNSGYHTNFKLSDQGEYIGLYNVAGQIVDSIYFMQQHFNTSRGRFPDGASSWYYYGKPTTGASNNVKGYLKISAAPVPSRNGGIYNTSIKIGLKAGSGAAKIYYTTNGAEPDELSKLYTDSIQIDTTTTIRARAYDTAAVQSSILTQTYFINVHKSLPIISISVDPRFMWDDSIGIYVKGVNGIKGPYNEANANYYREWERAANLEMITPDGKQAFNIGAGVAISGNYTRALPEKSFEINFSHKYGAKKLTYPLFASKPLVKDFYSLFLRNSGNDWKYTAAKWRGIMFKDALIHTLVSAGQMDIDYQAYQPAAIYINGQYRGLLNMREKLDEDYVGENYPAIDRDSLDIIKQIGVDPWQVTAGDTSSYNRFLEYLRNHDLSQKPVYDYVKTQMDIRNFINYQVVETWVCNNDWPSNNQKEWKPRYGNYKWRWMLFDTDPAMASTLLTTPEVDMIALSGGAMNEWASVVVDNLMKNQDFKNEYAQTYAAHINTTFNSTRVNYTIDSLKKNIESEMTSHINFWKATPEAIPSVTQWQTDVAITKDFASRRNDLNWPFLKNKVGKGVLVNVSLKVSPAGAGTIYIHGARVNDSSLTGSFFNFIPIEFLAKTATGHSFSRWEIVNNNQKYSRYGALLNDTLEGTYTIIAHFDETGLKDNQNNSFAVYPNPVADILTLKSDEDKGRIEITITGIDGNCVMTRTDIFNESITIPVHSLAPGLYMLRVTTGSKNETLKFIKH